MAGTKSGGRKAAATNKKKHGDDFYQRIGRQGGSKSHRETRPFAVNPELARAAGAKGGKMSRRGPSEQPRKKKQVEVKPTAEVDKTKKGLFGWFSGRRNK